jgi:hypothetical protein
MLPFPPAIEPPRIPSRVAHERPADRERRRRIAETAYSLGARRGFDGGSEQALEDWLSATSMVDETAAAPGRPEAQR